MDSTSIDELSTALEEPLVKLLDLVRGDPWSLLIFQTLIWSFRRWAVHYLVSEEMDTDMHDYLWDSHIDLVKNYAPEGLQEFGVVWLSPANLGDRIDLLDQLNAYFLFIVDRLNNAIVKSNEDEQNTLAIFLDETITDILTEWLEGRTEYRIYPEHTESSESFPMERIFTIMQNILEKNARPRVEILPPPVNEKPVILQTLHVPVFVPEPITAPPEPITAPPEPITAPPEPLAKPLHMTIAAALKRRKTLRLHGRRAESTPPNKASTRKRKVAS